MVFEQLLQKYILAKEQVYANMKVADLDVKDISKMLDSSISTAYSKLNGNADLLHQDYIIIAEILKMDTTHLKNYADFLIRLSTFIQTNKMFRQDYFLNIIEKDNIGIKKRFKNPLLWKPDEVRQILIHLKKDLRDSPLGEVVE
jgi:hypothetical protein